MAGSGVRPRIGRPYMPGYGVRPAGEGTGLLPWSWAQERLESSHNYWLVSSWPDAWAFGLQADDFTGSPTRWDFEA